MTPSILINYRSYTLILSDDSLSTVTIIYLKMLDYLKAKRGKSPAQVATADAAPILTAEDEDFFRRITTEVATPSATELPPTLPPRPHELPETGNPTGNDAQVVLRDHDHDSEPPTSYFPAEGSAHTSRGLDDVADSTSSDKKAKSKWSWMRRDSRDAKKKSTALGLKSAAEQGKASDTAMNEQRSELDVEAEKEEHEMANALEQLNLAAVDNRVFSISKETRELLAKFTLVLKDLMNGVPTAYNDLESLLTNSDDQLSKAYKHLPSWLQRLVQQLPSKMSKSVTPEVLAAAAEKHGVKSKYAEMAAHGAGKAGLKVKVPSLKDLVTKPGAVAGMLKAILNFLKLRFPAFLGLNVLYSLGLFGQLPWYCQNSLV